MAVLQVDLGDLQGQIIELVRETTAVGRSQEECDLVISKNDKVGRRHALITRINDSYYLEDPKSKNRTYLNDQLVPHQTRVQLKHEDRIRIMEFEATFLDDGHSTVEAALSSKSDHSLEKQPAAKLALLLEITAKLSKTLQLDAQLPEVGDGLLRLFPQANRCFLIVADEQSGNLRPCMIRTRRPGRETVSRFSHTIVRQCLSSAQALLWREGDKMPVTDHGVPGSGSSDSVVTFKMRSVMCVPLLSTDGPAFGVIQLDTEDGAIRFTEEDLRLFWGIAQQTSIAMENARYHEFRLAQERVQQEMKMARRVHRSFLPQRLPTAPGYEFYAFYEPAREIGGDYYDFIQLPDQNLAITLADVAGKGIPAALLVARLSSELRSCFLTESQPTAAVCKLNGQLHPITAPMDRFVTMATAVLDPTTHMVTLISAGHPAPLLYRAAEHKFDRAIPTDDDGQALGISVGERYQCYQVQLGPGDSLLLYSDGVTDAQSGSGKAFRGKGILGILADGARASPRILGERVVDAVQRHAAGVNQCDDITLICFGRPA